MWCDDGEVDEGLGSDAALAVTVHVTLGKSRARPQVFACKVKRYFRALRGLGVHS